MARVKRNAATTRQPSRPINGGEFKSMRKGLHLTQEGMAALLHLLGGTAPARSTIARYEGKGEVPPDVTMILRMLTRFHCVQRPQVPVHMDSLPEWRARKAKTMPALAGLQMDAVALHVDGEWKAFVLDLVRSGKRLAPQALDGVNDDGFLLELALYDPAVVAEYALQHGYGPVETPAKKRAAGEAPGDDDGPADTAAE